jgi:hypothetical protein
MKQPNPQAEEAQVKAIFGPENQFVNWVGTLQFQSSCSPVAEGCGWRNGNETKLSLLL